MITRSLIPPATLLLAALACSRQDAESRPPSSNSPMTPAAGTAAPQTPAARPGCLANFEAFDADEDGRVSKDEFSLQPHAHPDPAAVFQQRDRDGDGALTSDEFCSGWRGALPSNAGTGMPMGPRSAGPGPRKYARRGSGGPMMGARCDEHFDEFDVNRDGKLTKEEFLVRPHARGDAETVFGQRDIDHDGTIERSEFCSGWRPAR